MENVRPEVLRKAQHLYCVVGKGKGLDSGLIGLDGGRVSAIRHDGLAVLVSRAPSRPYRSVKREEVLRYLSAHQAIIEKVMADHTVVPVKFGTTARDEMEVRRILENGYPVLKEALEAMEGKIEVDLVAQWNDLNSVLRQIGEEPEIRRQKAVLAIRPPVRRLVVNRVVSSERGDCPLCCLFCYERWKEQLEPLLECQRAFPQLRIFHLMDRPHQVKGLQRLRELQFPIQWFSADPVAVTDRGRG